MWAALAVGSDMFVRRGIERQNALRVNNRYCRQIHSVPLLSNRRAPFAIRASDALAKVNSALAGRESDGIGRRARP